MRRRRDRMSECLPSERQSESSCEVVLAWKRSSSDKAAVEEKQSFGITGRRTAATARRRYVGGQFEENSIPIVEKKVSSDE